MANAGHVTGVPSAGIQIFSGHVISAGIGSPSMLTVVLVAK